MSFAEFPVRTAGTITLPNGDTVWVCTLNTLLYEEADSEIRWYAQKKCRRYLKGGTDFAELLARVKSMDAEEQSAFLAQQEFYTILRETNEKHPLPMQPEQGDQTAEAFTKSVMAWEEACKKVELKRTKYQQTRYDAEIKKNAALTQAVRIERCCIAYFQQEFGKAFTMRRVSETLYRATRHDDEHTKRYFCSAEAYEDADDSVQNVLTKYYFETLDTVQPSETPTLPAES